MLWCLISEPSGTVHELILDHDVKGVECLEKVCSRLQLVERDYFGLRYNDAANGVEFWLNLRNPLCHQISGKPPYRLKFAPKFFVKPQELQQPITRDLFYFTCRQQLQELKYDFTYVDSKTFAKLYSLIAQVEHGEYNPDSLPNYSSFFPCEKWSADFEQHVESSHLELERMTADEAKIEILHILANRLQYGVETFHVNSATAKNTSLVLLCRYDGLRIYKKEPICKKKATKEKISDQNIDTEVVFKENTVVEKKPTKSQAQLLQFIPYEEISTVSYKGKLFTISYGDISSHNQKKLGFKLKVQKETVNLFRTFTEFHSFYQCNMVKKSVMEKCTRSSVGRVASFFRPNTRIGRQYLFDVVRTRRQAYNAAWKELNAPDKRRQSTFYSSERAFGRKGKGVDRFKDQRMCQSVIMKRKPSKMFIESDSSSEDDIACLHPFKMKGKKITTDIKKIGELTEDQLRDVVRTLQDSRTCQVCMDSEVSTAFCPCGHVVCCVQCSALVKECPLCRAHITYAQRVFFSCEQQSF